MNPQRVRVATGALLFDLRSGARTVSATTWVVDAIRVVGRNSWRFTDETGEWSVPDDYVTVMDPSVVVEFKRPRDTVWEREVVASLGDAVTCVKRLRRQGRQTRFVH